MTLRVIIADDEDRIREGMAAQVESMGLDLRVVGTAANGIEALALVDEYVPEIILMDINMPFMDGLESIRLIREKDPDCVIVIVSGYERFDYAQKALQYGVDYYLLKPVEDDEFVSVLADAIRKHAERIRRRPRDTGIPERVNSPENIIAYIKEHCSDKDLSIERLETAFHMSRSALFKTVKHITGVSTIDYITSLRIERAKALLLDPRGYAVKEVCDAAGYSDQHYFSRVFKQYTGASPSGYRESAAQKDTSGKQ